jgi:hypothetical protein
MSKVCSAAALLEYLMTQKIHRPKRRHKIKAKGIIAVSIGLNSMTTVIRTFGFTTMIR